MSTYPSVRTSSTGNEYRKKFQKRADGKKGGRAFSSDHWQGAEKTKCVEVEKLIPVNGKLVLCKVKVYEPYYKQAPAVEQRPVELEGGWNKPRKLKRGPGGKFQK